MTGGTDDGYFPKPPNGRFPSYFQLYELPNIKSDRLIVFHVPKQIVAGKQCGSDQESYQRLLDTNQHARYTCCELAPLIAPGTDTSSGLPPPSTEYGRNTFSKMKSILSRIGKSNISHCETFVSHRFLRRGFPQFLPAGLLRSMFACTYMFVYRYVGLYYVCPQQLH